MSAKRFLLSCMVLAAAAPMASGQATVEWGTSITYDDFRAAPASADTAAANISVTILLGYSASPEGALNFRVVAVMDRDQSWIKNEFRKDHILHHERGHFDIAQLYARKLDAHLRGRKYTSRDEDKLGAVYDDFLDRMHKTQVRYDRETRGGWNALAQSKWRRWIEDELRAAR